MSMLCFGQLLARENYLFLFYVVYRFYRAEKGQTLKTHPLKPSNRVRHIKDAIQLTLTRLEAWVFLVNHIKTTFAANNAAITVSNL